MDTEGPKNRLSRAGSTARRTALLGAATLVVLVMYAGLGYLVYENRVGDGPFLLFTGFIVGYILRSIRDTL